MQGGPPDHKATSAKLPFLSQDEKNQVLTTYIWYRQVSGTALLPRFLRHDLPFQEGFLHLKASETQRPWRGKGGEVHGRVQHEIHGEWKQM